MTHEPDEKADVNDIEPMIDKGYGLIMGGAIGDSLGSFVEFSFSAISDEQMQIVLSMPGEGGTWNNCCTKGQVTDDTEIGIALVYALLHMKNENDNKFDLKYICLEYYKWFVSGPFDIGKTTVKSITQCDEGKNVIKMIESANKHNIETKQKYRGLGGVRSNGSLMRIMPLILYCYKIYKYNQNMSIATPYDAIYEIVKTESSLTHYNQTVFHCCMAYTVAAIYLLHHCNDKDRNKKAYFEAKTWLLHQLKTYYDLQNDEENTNDDEDEVDEENTLEIKIARCTEVLEWIFNAVENDDDEYTFSSTTQNIGYIKIAFERTFYYLYNGYKYEAAIIEVIQSGGDTDTNANIVGAMLGCYYGLNELHKQTSKYKWIENVQQCEPKVDYEKRKLYQPRVYFEQKIVEQLLL